MVPPPATVAPETTLCPRAGTDGTFGWLVRLCLKILVWLVQIEEQFNCRKEAIDTDY